MRSILVTLMLLSSCGLWGKSTNFEYDLNIMEGVQVWQSWAGIRVSIGGINTSEPKYLLAETSQRELRRNKIMTFSYKYRIWPVKPRLNDWKINKNTTSVRNIMPIYNPGRMISFYTLSNIPHKYKITVNDRNFINPWNFEFDFAPFGTNRSELVYGPAAMPLRFYKTYDVKVTLDMANDIIAFNIDDYKVIYRKKIAFYPNYYGFVQSPFVSVGRSLYRVPDVEIIDFRVHYGLTDYQTRDFQYPRFHIDNYLNDKKNNKTENDFWAALCYYEGNHGAMKDYVQAVKLFEKAARDNHIFAQYYAGICYMYGRGVPQNDDKAYEYFRRAARNYYDDAAFMAALLQCTGRRQFDQGAGVSSFLQLLGPAVIQGHANSFYLNGWRSQKGIMRDAGISGGYPEAALRGHPKAMLLGSGRLSVNEFMRRCETTAKIDFIPGIVGLGDCYFYGRGVERNLAEAFRLYQRAADMGSENAMIQLALCYYNGNGVEKNTTESEKIIRNLEARGNRHARLIRGVFDEKPDKGSLMYFNRQFPQAFAHWSLGKNHWDFYRAGLCLLDGIGTKRDSKRAFNLLTQSDLPEAKLEVAECYQNGIGVNHKNYNTAFEYYKQAANYPPGALAYAYKCLERGQGTEALNAASFAAKAGNPEAMYLFGILRLRGAEPLLRAEPERALDPLTVAAKNGSIEAMLELGNCYYHGVGTKADKEKAAEWWTKYQLASDSRDNNNIDELSPYWPALPNHDSRISVKGMPRYVSDWTDPEAISQYYRKY